MEEHRNNLIALATSDPYFMRVCRKINSRYAEDLFQEVCIELLTMPVERLPILIAFKSFFYRTAFNMSTSSGTLGRVVSRGNEVCETCYENTAPIRSEASANELAHERKLRQAERFLLNLPEFENRIAILYNELGDMKKVQRATGISYSALRYVKSKLRAQVI